MRKILFTPTAFAQYNEWQTENKQVFNRLKKLIVETARTPFDGTGKPEALKYEYAGCWIRRITEEHRLVYKVDEFVICYRDNFMQVSLLILKSLPANRGWVQKFRTAQNLQFRSIMLSPLATYFCC